MKTTNLKRCLLGSVALGLLPLSLVACFQAEPSASESDSTQSAVAVKSQTQTLNFEPLSKRVTATSVATAAELYTLKASDVTVQDEGTVVKILADDNKGARHQKFLVKIAAGQTLLFAHNIDLAPRIDNIQVGDALEFKGEYVYNPKGGIVHWTHHDPQGKHDGGWIKHHGNTYQ